MKRSTRLRTMGAAIAIAALLFSDVASASGRISVNESSANKSYKIKVGSTITMTLHSMYWSLTPLASNAALKSKGDPVQSPIMPGPNAPAGCGIPGSGCGTQVWKFTATKAGVTQLAATRTSCGEAMQCTGDQGKFAVTIRVVK
jgi:hypothetical protein